MDLSTVGTVLWVVAGCLMVAGVAGVGLSLLLDRSAAQAVEAEKPIWRKEARPPVPVEQVPKPVDAKVLAARKVAYRQGLLVLGGLAVLTAVEFWLGVVGFSTAFLFVIILAKAGLILQYYMHVNRAWSEEEAHG